MIFDPDWGSIRESLFESLLVTMPRIYLMGGHNQTPGGESLLKQRRVSVSITASEHGTWKPNYIQTQSEAAANSTSIPWSGRKGLMK